MKRKLLLIFMIIPIFAAGYVMFHPGVAFTETPFAKNVPAVFPQEGDFTIDPAHTSIGFDIGHLGLSRVQGRFSKPVGSIHADAKNVSRSSVTINIDAASIDTAVAPRDTHLRSPDFFDVAKYPEITFVSKSIRKRGSSYIAAGDLTIHGVTKMVSIKFKVYGPIKDPWGKTRIGMVSEPLTIHRSDFAMTHDQGSISDDVIIRLSLEATLNK